LSIALLVGWTLVILQNADLSREVTSNTWLLVLGILSLVIIMGVLVWFSIFLVREIMVGRRQTAFIDSVTHELKSPLASLKLCLETLAREDVNPTQRQTLREMMLGDVERLATFIEDILVATRVAHRSFLERPSHLLNEVRLMPMVARCIDVLTRRHGVAPDAVEIVMPESLALVTDSTAIETILKNLIDNALKYGGDPPRVVVRASVSESDGWLTIDVTDQGIGIEARHIKHIFGRFYRVPSEGVRSRHGTGLGLFVASALVRNLGGRLEALSEGAGRGSCMRIRLPPERSRATGAG